MGGRVVFLGQEFRFNAEDRKIHWYQLHPSHFSQATRRPNPEGQPEYTQELKR